MIFLVDSFKLKVGDIAPEFCLLDKDENEVCLRNFHGKWIILYFYPKDNTKGCTIEAIDFTAQLSEFSKLGAVVLGISPDSTLSHQKFTDKHELKVKLLSDTEHTVLEQYGIWQEKSLYGRTYFGVVRSTFLINSVGTIAEVWEKVRVANHVENVKNRLLELQQ